ncbi:hypothetical protein BKA70DRAFT_1204937 [Coprinopsis sp. MPI-PUGE-AT-0042]|nr:hypothetical protein BKA70DRAFT_1204937 [Coprinopsis sp. MPI-PUGE-AT-0042]
MGATAEVLGASLTKGEVQLKAIYLVGTWVEALLYGLYLCLFIGAIAVYARKEVHKPFASKVFLAGNILMFIGISFHNVLSVYRLLVGFAHQPDVRAQLLYLNDLRNWSALASPFLLATIMWTGDALVIYRCFLIWQRNYLVVALPSLLYIVTVGLQVTNLWWVARQSTFGSVIGRRWPTLRITFPLYFAQNVLTTGLILFKIWSRHRSLRNAGITSLNTPSLVDLMRAIVESAAIYTAALLVMAVLRLLDHPGWFVSHVILYPTIGIMFVLMAIRVHVVQEEAKHNAPSPSLLPSWILGNQEQAVKVISTNRNHQESDSSNSTKDNDSRPPYQMVELHQVTCGEREQKP